MLRPAVVALVAATALALGGAPALGRGEAFVQFRTPSGNIGCGYGSVAGERRFLRCDILSGIRPLPPKPRDCREDWGTAISLGRTGRASLICVGDTVLDLRSRILRYGQLWRRGGFTCSSRATGLTCTNRSRHGFVLSRERSRLF